MIKIENTDVLGWEHAIRGLRNPLNSWDKSDSAYGCRLKKERDCVNWNYHTEGEITLCKECNWCERLCEDAYDEGDVKEFIVGSNDFDLMKRLAGAGSDHAKYRRMIIVYADVTAPLYWWKEYDTYKVGTVANSCSTMHKIADKAFTFDDFSCEHLSGTNLIVLNITVDALNNARLDYLDTKDKSYWWQMIQLLPSSYNQRRTVQLNYEVLANMYHSRKSHKLDEWREFCNWVETLPYSELITGGK